MWLCMKTVNKCAGQFEYLLSRLLKLRLTVSDWNKEGDFRVQGGRQSRERGVMEVTVYQVCYLAPRTQNLPSQPWLCDLQSAESVTQSKSIFFNPLLTILALMVLKKWLKWASVCCTNMYTHSKDVMLFYCAQRHWGTQTLDGQSELTDRLESEREKWEYMPLCMKNRNISPFRTLGTFCSSYNCFCTFRQHNN